MSAAFLSRPSTIGSSGWLLRRTWPTVVALRERPGREAGLLDVSFSETVFRGRSEVDAEAFFLEVLSGFGVLGGRGCTSTVLVVFVLCEGVADWERLRVEAVRCGGCRPRAWRSRFER